MKDNRFAIQYFDNRSSSTAGKNIKNSRANESAGAQLPYVTQFVKFKYKFANELNLKMNQLTILYCEEVE